MIDCWRTRGSLGGNHCVIPPSGLAAILCLLGARVTRFYIESHGSAIPDRLKARGPGFCTLSILGELCGEVLLADGPAIIGSTDVVMGEVDR